MLYTEQTFAPRAFHSALQQQTNTVNTQKSPPWACDKRCAEACAERFSALKLRTRTRFRPPKIRLHCRLQKKATSYPGFSPTLPTEFCLRSEVGRVGENLGNEVVPEVSQCTQLQNLRFFVCLRTKNRKKRYHKVGDFSKIDQFPYIWLQGLGGIKQKAQQRIIHFFCFIPPSLGAKHEF